MVGEEEDMHLEDTVEADLTALEEVDPTGPAEVAMDLAEAATDQDMEGEEYQWVRWQPEQGPA